jgi:hypothetical protein
MSTLIEFLILGILALAAAMVTRSLNRRRAAGRNTALAGSGSAEFPCRLSWEAGTGKKAFVYGKVRAGKDGGLAFSRLGGALVSLPRSDWVHREKSWRADLVTLRYTAPGKGEVRMLLSEADAELVERRIRRDQRPRA